jgi:protocatechuate 4,5-dioxygenase alpha chain
MADDDISAKIEYDKATARSLEGTYLFDGLRAKKNYALNKMCMSLTKPDNRAAFASDEGGYCQKYGLDDETTGLVTARDWIGMVRSGGNIYYVFKLAAISHVSMQHVGAQQNSMSLDQFRAKLNSHKESDHG